MVRCGLWFGFLAESGFKVMVFEANYFGGVVCNRETNANLTEPKTKAKDMVFGQFLANLEMFQGSSSKFSTVVSDICLHLSKLRNMKQ